MKKSILFVTIGAIALAIGVSTLYLKEKAVSYVKISINPDIQLALDNNDEVVDVVAINDDADVLLSDLDLVGLTLEEATDKIIDESVETGFIDELSETNTILVEAVNEDEEKRLFLESAVVKKVKANIEEKGIKSILAAVKLDETLKTEAEELGVSNGKMLLIATAVSINSELVKADLAELTIKDIQAEIKEVTSLKRLEAKENKAEYKEELKEQKQLLKEKHLKEVEEMRKEIKEQIKNFNNLSPADQKIVENQAIARFKADVETKFDTLQAELQQKFETSSNVAGQEPYKQVSKDLVEAVREAIQRKGR